jgi:hypothetical protein
MQTHGQPPRPVDARASLISGRVSVWLQPAARRKTRGEMRGEERGAQSGLSSISGYGAQQHNGRMAAWENLNNGRGCRRPSSPSWAPRQRQQVLVHAFCRTVCMAIATLAAVNQFVFAYLHIRLKALTDIKIAGERLRALSRWWSSSRRSRSQIGWLQVSSQFALTGGMSAVLVWVSTAPGRVTLFCNRSRR